METSPRQISIFTEDESTSSPEGFRASLTPKQVSDLEKKMTATSGRICLEQFGRFSHVGSWARTFAGLLIGMTGWYSTKCSLTWKLKGTKSNRFYFQLAPSTHPTDETEFGLLPTIKTVDSKDQLNKNRETKLENGSFVNIDKDGVRWGANLVDIVRNGLLPTPTATDWKGAYPPSSIDKNPARRGLLRNAYQYTEGEYHSTNSQLNPRFVMEMMGFPPDWTELPFQNGETNQSKPEVTQ